MTYKCDSCGRIEESDKGPPKCACALPNHITLMKPLKTKDNGGKALNEYLTEG